MSPFPDSLLPRSAADGADPSVAYRAGPWGWTRRIVLFFGVVVAVGLGITQTEWGEERIRRLAVQAIEQELGFAASIQDVEVEVGLWPPGIRVAAHGIELDHREHGEFAKADELIIRPSMLALVSGGIDLQGIELRRPTLHLKIREGRLLNIPDLPESGGGEPDIPFEELRVVDGTVEVDVQPFSVVQLEGVDLLVQGEGRSLKVELEEASGRVFHAGGEDPVRRIALEGNVELGDTTIVEIASLNLESAPAQVEIRDALLPVPLTTGWTARVIAECDVSRLLEMMEPFGLEGPPIEGALAVDLQMRGEYDGPHGDGRIRLSNGRIDDRYGLGDLDLQVELDPTVIHLREGSKGHIILDGGEVALEGSVEPRRRSRVSVASDRGRFRPANGEIARSDRCWPGCDHSLADGWHRFTAWHARAFESLRTTQCTRAAVLGARRGLSRRDVDQALRGAGRPHSWAVAI